jgi:D-glucosaminate-6-phosphate ammonia-lyase
MSAGGDAWSSIEVRFGRRPGKHGSAQILKKELGGEVQLAALAGHHVEFGGIGQDVRAKRPHFTPFHPALGIVGGKKAAKPAGEDQGRRCFHGKHGGLVGPGTEKAMIELGQIAAPDQAGRGNFLDVRLACRDIEHRVATAAIEVVDFAEQPLIAQPGDLLMARHDGDLQLPGQHAALEIARREHLKRQLDRVIATVEALDRGSDGQVGMGDDAVRHADGEGAAQLLAARCDMGLKAIKGGKELAGRAVDGLAVLGQAKPAATALAKPQAQPGLEIMHVGADRRLGDIEERLGSSKAAAFGDSGEHPQKAQIGIAHPSKHFKPAIDPGNWPGEVTRFKSIVESPKCALALCHGAVVIVRAVSPDPPTRTVQLMASPPAIFARLGLKPVINACGVYTDLGGSRLTPTVLAGMAEMNGQFVSMPELLDATGARIAELLEAPAARVTPGAAAAIMLATAAAMAGGDGAKGERLPDSSGMKSEVLIQAGHRYKYDRQVLMAGARLIEVGSQNGTRPDQLTAAITANTAMVIHPAHLDGKPGTIGLEQVVQLAHQHGVPVLVDAAYMVYPTALMGSYVGRGADLVAISSKYFGGPNAGGFVIGSKEQVKAITAFDFTRYESGRYRKFGRPLKMDRQMVAAVVLALEEWLATNHAARLQGEQRRVELLRAHLRGLSGLKIEPKCFTMDERFIDGPPVNCLLVTVDERKGGMSAAGIATALAEGEPRILAVQEGAKIGFVTDLLNDDETEAIGRRLRGLLEA